MQSKSFTILKIVFSLGVISVLLSQSNLDSLWIQLQHLSRPFIIFALLYYTACQWLSCIRWQVILKSNRHIVPINRLLSSYLSGMFFNNFLPGAFGGDFYRVYKVTQSIKDSEAALVSVLIERTTGLIALSTLAVLGLIPAFKVIGRWDIVLIFFACLATLISLVILLTTHKLLIISKTYLGKVRYLKKIIPRISKSQILFKKFSQNSKALSISMFLSVILNLAVVYYHYLIAQQLNISISFLELLVLIPMISVITLFPISFGGLGLREGLWVYFFNRIGLTSEQAILFCVTLLSLGWTLALCGGFLFILDLIASGQYKKNE
jgi:glycosyltransferase 2 family protein